MVSPPCFRPSTDVHCTWNASRRPYRGVQDTRRAALGVRSTSSLSQSVFTSRRPSFPWDSPPFSATPRRHPLGTSALTPGSAPSPLALVFPPLPPALPPGGEPATGPRRRGLGPPGHSSDLDLRPPARSLPLPGFIFFMRVTPLRKVCLECIRI